jgi:hypothetical protein
MVVSPLFYKDSDFSPSGAYNIQIIPYYFSEINGKDILYSKKLPEKGSLA